MSREEIKTEVFIVSEMEETGEKKKSKYERYVQPCLAEVLGTFILVFVGCMSVVGNSGTSPMQPALSQGLTVAVLITMFAPISGGHFNPVVSLSFYLCGEMDLFLLLPYVLAQMIGATIAAFLTKTLYPADLYTKLLGGAFVTGAVGTAMLAETVFTLILIVVVCLGGINKVTQSPWAPICVGLIVAANILSGATVSGACMNPVRAFGPAVAANHWEDHWVYWLGPTCGTLLAVVFIRVFLGDQKTRLVLK
ncbi:aquaporin-8-like [Salarias fasciatus]|uniref:Aquaporin-8-like n=1 Tax=Salarias fasciatus TaxID=181472 RepID=A0A672H5E1_SALFA|nr:aquaporin-8-like [Salarias fasciatus]